ncbi:MAG: hypothetical protein JNL83_32425 [Myxococcales bacterium]|nr:hypothetical protein [Myxococcales bacterium]
MMVLWMAAAGCADVVGDVPEEVEDTSELAGCYATIDAKYAAFGGAGGFLGQPLIPQSVTSGGDGVFRAFQGGAIYKKNGGCAYAVQGGIAAKWGEANWERGVLGFPVSDEEWASDHWGRVSHFERGSIYWNPSTGSAIIRSTFRTKWLALGGINSPLGYPVRDQVNGVRPPAVQVFEWGTIFDPVISPARAVFGAIGVLHRELGSENGVAGVPTTDEYNCWPASLGTRCQRFQRGIITWTAAGGARFIPN